MSIYYNISAPAKLNLNLFVKEKFLNGLHFLESDICFLELSDKVYVKFSKKDIFYQNKNNSFLINPKDNLILQAIKKFRSHANWNRKFEIYLDKNIPIGAGLGGGSADAAAMLVLLRQLFNKEKNNDKMPISKIFQIGNELGSDVPSCIMSKDLRLSGYGKEIRRKKFPNNYFFLIVYPNFELSTKSVFRNFSNFENINHKSKDIYFENIRIYNSLLFSAISMAPKIKDILDNLKKITNIVAYGMTGSGSTCFGIFKNLKDVPKLGNIFDDKYFIWFGQKADYNLNRVCCSKVLENKF
jgi:4-diphosphocytidyl-2-C-methyl-D-erythritol kinase